MVSALDAVASQLRETSSGIQQLRANADQDIASSVDGVNSDLEQIADLNTAIKQAAAAGQSTADLEDQRNTALQDVTSKMNISYFTASNGDLQIYYVIGSGAGRQFAHTISYTPSSSVTASTTYGSRSASAASWSTASTSPRRSARAIGAPGHAARQHPAGNAVATRHAGDTARHQPQRGVERADLAAAAGQPDRFDHRGRHRHAVRDRHGAARRHRFQRQPGVLGDLDLSSYTTVGDLVTAINGISGLSASIDADGHLVIGATGSGNGVAINQMTSAVGSSGEGFSSYFGLNDLVTATGASDFAVRSDILSGASSLPLATLDSSAILTTGSTVVTSNAASVVDTLYQTLTGSTSFAAVGGLSATTGSFADFAATIVSNVASRASQASSTYTAKEAAQSTYANSLSSQSGVNLDEETANLSELQNKYSAASELIQIINSMYSALLTAVQSAG